MSEAAVLARETRQLRRLEVLVDSVYALVIVLLVANLPTPRDVGWTGSSPWEYLQAQRGDLLVAALGLALVIGYWLQNNAMFGSLARTDNRFATLAILQILMLLAYLFSMGLGLDFEQHELTLALQSGSLLLMGVVALAAWSYATRDRRLVADVVTAGQLHQVRLRLLPEPLTAALTLAVSPLGSGAWELAWLAFPLAAWGVNRWGRRRGTEPAPDA